MHSLPLFVRLSGRPVILVGDGDMAAAKRALLERAGALIVDESAQASLAIVALADNVVAEAAIARLKARGILVNAVDRPEQCDFTLPAIIDRDPVLIAIGTGGASAGLAKALRQRLERLLPQTLGRLAQQLAAARPALRARFPNAADRRRAIDAALETGGALDCLSDVSAEALAKWLSDTTVESAVGYHHIILYSDDPDDLSLRQARLLASADRIYHSADVDPAILARGRADAVRAQSDLAPAKPKRGLTLFLERR